MAKYIENLVLSFLLLFLFLLVTNTSSFGSYPYSESCSNEYHGHLTGNYLFTDETMNNMLNNFISYKGE